MDKNTETKSLCNKAQCPHGMCFKHKPDWDRSAEVVLEPVIFESRFLWFHSAIHIKSYSKCCGLSMKLFYKVRELTCSDCGRRAKEFLDTLAICGCCGFRTSKLPAGDIRWERKNGMILSPRGCFYKEAADLA